MRSAYPAVVVVVVVVVVGLGLVVGFMHRDVKPSNVVPSSVAPAVTSAPAAGTELAPARDRRLTVEEWLARPQ